MSSSSADRNPVDRLAEEFAARYRQGERPSLTDYVARCPEHADEIREVFPALVIMEQLKPAAPDATGALADHSAPAEGRTPERLGDYRILREVGRGGMGVVYEAEQVSLGRHVALKVLPAHALLNPTHLERFRREARAAAQLHHTNIVPVFGVGEEGGVHFYAMQFIRGEGLDRVLHDLRRLRDARGGPAGADRADAAVPSEPSVAQGLLAGQFAPPPAVGAGGAGRDAGSTATARVEPQPSTVLSAAGSDTAYSRSVARVGLQAAEALAYAHRQGVLHRDVKPSNLLLDAQGAVWITDFGLAKAEGADELTQAGDIVGTIRFMAPERFDGRSLPQSDVYSLGLTLYEMLTLRPAFEDGNKARLVEKVLHEPPAPPRKLDPHIPRDLETVVLKCLAKDPAERYASAEAVAEDLRRFLADRPIWARRAGPWERLWRWCRRNPAVAGLTGLVLGLLVMVAVGGVVLSLRLREALGQAEGDRDRAQGAERAARMKEAEALVEQARGIRSSRRPGQRFEALAALDKAAAIGRELGLPPKWFDRLRNEAIAALALPDLHITHAWPGVPPGTESVALSHDFTLYARINKQGACSIRRVADDVEIARLKELGEPASATFAAGGRLLRVANRVANNSGRSQLWDLSGGKAVPLLDEQHTWASFLRPDGRLIAFRHPNGSISSIYATDTKRRHLLRPPGIPNAGNLCLHPTAPIMATCSYASNLLQMRDLKSGNVLVTIPLPWRGSAGSCWSPDGRTLAVAEGDGGRVHLYAFDAAAPRLHLARVLHSQSNGGTVIRFNPAGDRVAAVGWTEVVELFDVFTGRLLFSIPQSCDHLSLAFDLTGRRLGAARVGIHGDQVGLWAVADAREYRALGHDGHRRHRNGDYLPALHPGGRLVAAAYEGGLAMLDLMTGRELMFVKVPGGVSSANFDDAGTLLTAGPGGPLRWPVRPDPAGSGRLTVGPPQRLPSPPNARTIRASRDGKVIALATYGSGGWVLHPNHPQPRCVEPFSRLFYTDVSPDGRHVTFGGHLPQVNVYDMKTARLVFKAPTEGGSYGRFSRDGRWLVTDDGGRRAYRVGTWEPGPRLAPGTPWDVSPDSRLVALGMRDGVIRLVELATGRELAWLEDPEQRAGRAAFTPDGTRLVVSTEDGPRVWDLRLIRKGLTRLGLDWDAPPYPEAADGVPSPLEVTILGTLPPDPTQLNNRAWRLATGPGDQRDPVQALKLIQQALELRLGDGTFLNTLGVIQYRNGQYAAAVATLEKSLRITKGGWGAFDQFFLAMSHAKLGDAAKAKDCFDRAVKWTAAQKNLAANSVEELRAFRAEAEAVLKGK
jgi:serine/threonine protein kinase/WD40 repeat protein